jgi:short-subunit dehydrogenase
MLEHKQLKDNLSGIITGASSGIGKELAIILAKKYKAQLVLNARDQSTLNETANLVRQYGGQAQLVVGDLSDSALAAQLVDKCIESFGAVDLLVNNAGLAKPGSLLLLTPDHWKKVFAVNFFAPLTAIYQALPHMLKAGGGKIVNVASVAGKIAFPGSVCYAASKFALTGMSEGMAAELSPKNIDFITVCPGWVRSEFFAKNQCPDDGNPTKIAEQTNWRGFLMRNVLSISSESCAQEIIDALEKGGSAEIILTAPGVFAERMNAFFPGLMATIARHVRA